MTRNGFIGLLLLTVAAVAIGAWVAEHYVEPGLGRTLIVAAFTALVLFPCALFAERRGWIRGGLDLSKIGQVNGRRDSGAERGDAK